MRIRDRYRREDAAHRAAEWCARNAGWLRICDLTCAAALQRAYEALPEPVRDYWAQRGGFAAWKIKHSPRLTSRIDRGFVTGAGEFLRDISEVPIGHGMMMVFRLVDAEVLR